MILFYSILTCVGDDHDFFFHATFFFFYELFTIFYLFYFFHLLHSRHITTPPSFISYTHQPISLSFISHSLVCIIPIHCGTWIEFRDHIRLYVIIIIIQTTTRYANHHNHLDK